MPLRPRLHAARLRAPLCTLLVSVLTLAAEAQPVQVGLGSYSTTLPSGEIGPQNAAGQSVVPKRTADIGLPVQSNDWWSSLTYPFFGDPYSNILYAHPINARATAAGLQIGTTTEPVFVAADYLYPFAAQLTVGVEGLAASRAETAGYGDWTVTARWTDGPRTMEATLGHGLPYVFFEMTGGRAVLTPAQTPTIWSNSGGVLGLTVAGRHYGVFAPPGAVWTGTNPLVSTLDGQGTVSVALLPDAQPGTLELFRRHAYAFVTDSRVDWTYDEPSARLTATYTLDTELKGSDPTTVNETMTALYRHQWRHMEVPTTGLTYASPRGEMRLIEAGSFSTEQPFTGVLPALPDRGAANPADLLALVQQAAQEPLPAGPSYENGKAMSRVAHLVHIADQLGATAERDHFLSLLKTRLEDWFTVGGAQEYSYNATWDVLTGYPSGFGADNQINDHHFHASYAIQSAATIARFDPAWAAQEAWGGMVNLLVKDANNWDRDDERFPFLRTYDAYAGHSWAAGHGDFAEGNNQESSSESMNFASAVVLWGEATGQTEIRDLGIYLYTTEAAAVDQYWFDVDEAVFPASYPHVAIGMVWGSKGVHSTWFGNNPEFIHGINILPVTSGSLYLGHHPDFVTANYDEIVAERGGPPAVWKDVLWQYLALSDPSRALAAYLADPTYEPFDGESRAHTMHWLYTVKKMGRVEPGITADVPTFAVFRDGDDLTYIAYNAGAADRLVTFSDGYTMTVAPSELRSESTATENPDAPVALLRASATTGKAPLTVTFEGSRSFDPNDDALAFAWDFGDGRTSTEADTTVVFTALGERWVSLAVTDAQGFTARDSVRVTVLGNGTPYGGTPPMMPGTIEAEDYDLGGEGIAYHDVDANNIGLAYRPSEGVDIEGASTHGFDVYWITAGEWLEYTFEVPADGLYTITPYLSTVPGFGTFRLLIDNVDVSGERAVPGTGGWQSWQPFAVTNVPIEAGVHILRVEADSDSDATGWLFSLNWIEFEANPVNAEDGTAPPRLDLRQNAPNPVSATTRIDFAVPTAGPVALEVFDAVGRRVAVLAEGPHAPGTYTVTFDTGTLPSGVYLYRLTTPDGALTRRMAVLR